MTKTLYTSKGVPVVISRELGKGGEGTVFEVHLQPNQVAKLYHKVPEPKKQAKLIYMAAAASPQLLNYIAWPQETLHQNFGGAVVGFLMPKIAGKSPVHMIYSPKQRRQDFPNAGWDFLLYVARNIAATFETIHTHGHVIGDVNQNSFLVGCDAKVVLIDSDSFQVNEGGTVHLCEVGVSHFTPPEMQSLSTFRGFTRTVNHDNFGLALLIFHVLFGGRHPFSGVPRRTGVGDSLEADIKDFRYAYAIDNESRGISPPPHSIPVSILPNSINSMFHVAFTERGSLTRPSAKEWVSALDTQRKCLKRCGTSSIHIYPDHLATCPWCALEQCGVTYFFDVALPCATKSNNFDLKRVWGLIQAVPAPVPLTLPHLSSFAVNAQPLPESLSNNSTIIIFRALIVVIAIVFTIAIPTMLILIVILGLVLWWLPENARSADRASERAKRKRALETAKSEYELIVDLAKKSPGAEGFRLLKAELSNLYQELKNIPLSEKDEFEKLRSTAQERQRQRFLDTCYISKAKIPGVGPTRKADLRSFGIETAADVTKAKVLRIRGFGDYLAKAVVDWRASCERRFKFNPAKAISKADRNAVRAKYAAKRTALEQKLAVAPAELHQLRQIAEAQLVSLRPKLEAAARKLAQAQADYSLLK